MHRDISRNNLMYRVIEGKIYGVLPVNDFDLSVLLDKEPRSTSNQRTYMAVDLLVPTGPPPPHLYRFDLESLFYVLLFVVCQYHNGKKIDNPPFDEWDHLPTRVLCAVKKQFFTESMKVSLTPNFLALRNLTLLLHDMFSEGFNARRKADMHTMLGLDDTFDDITLGDHITFDKFEKILVANLPSQA
jgi:hypothetical protein